MQWIKNFFSRQVTIEKWKIEVKTDQLFQDLITLLGRKKIEITFRCPGKKFVRVEAAAEDMRVLEKSFPNCLISNEDHQIVFGTTPAHI